MRLGTLPIWVVVGFLVTLPACATGLESRGLAGDSDSPFGSGGGGGGGEAGTGGTALGAGGGAPSIPGCVEGADDVFVLGFDLVGPVLFRFHPQTLAFEELGPLVGCPAGTGFAGKNPWAAALDRKATLWAHYLEWDSALEQASYDRVHTIDTTTGKCADTGAGLSQPSGKLVEYGMSFVPSPADPATDILYASAMEPPAFGGIELATVDLGTMAMKTVGPLADTYYSYLTSSADGRLFTMYNTGDKGLRELDPADGKVVLDQPVTGLPSLSGPFAFWGGDLWIFLIADYEPTALRTDVYRVDMSTWTATKVVSVDFAVTAASVSSCAPLEMPK